NKIVKNVELLRYYIELIPERFYTNNYFDNNVVNIEETNLKVLIADDVKMNRMLLKEILERENISSKEASNGLEVLEMLEKEHFDVLLLDIQMPIKDGFETLKEIKSSKKLMSVYTIVLTANIQKNDIEMYYKAGCDDYISKPIDKNQIINKIKNLRNSFNSKSNQ
ncbi:MAG: response regulator, partial [Bacillota bacterium]|nr:response regulator [Bacillota bacterium]